MNELALWTEQRGAELRLSLGQSELDLEAAVETLGRAAVQELTIGGRLARDPWGWIAGACVVGVLLGMRGLKASTSQSVDD